MSGFLLRSARLVPLGDGETATQPVDVLVRDGRVAEVAPSLSATDVPAYHADGRWLLPGLWDQHVHLGQWTLASQRLDLAGTRSLDEALDRVARRLADSPDVPIVGWGHRSATWTEQPTAAHLDDLAGLRPVVLISGDGHHAWLNTVAMRGLRLPERAGVVSEGEWFAAYPRLVDLVGADGTSPDAYRHTMQGAAARGVVGLVDLEFDEDVRAWPERAVAGGELLRVRVGAYVETLPGFLQAGLRSGDRLPGCSPLVTMGPLKVISDGSLNTRTAWCCGEYAHGGGSGAPNVTADGLRELLGRARDRGLEAAVHAIGDRAVSAALDAFAATGARGSVEHAQLITREDSRRMAELGVRASVQPAHLLDDRDLTESFWPSETGRCFALRWMVDDGVELALGSDAPVSPLDPWLAASAAVHRSADDREPWHPEHALTPREALAASTDGWGTVAPGHPADLVLVDADPLAGEGSLEQGKALREMHVAATWVAGSLVHSALT